MKLGKYGMMIKKHMEETYPIRYQELIIDGTIMDKLLERTRNKEISRNYTKAVRKKVSKATYKRIYSNGKVQPND